MALGATKKDIQDLKVKSYNIGNTKTNLPIVDLTSIYLITIKCTSLFEGVFTRQYHLSPNITTLKDVIVDRASNYLDIEITITSGTFTIAYTLDGVELDDVIVERLGM